MISATHTQNSFINFVLVYLLLFVSGVDRYNQDQNKYFILVFLFSLGIWFLYTDRTINSKFLLFLTVFCGFLFSLSLYTGGSLSVASVINTTMKLLFAYLVLRTIGPSFTQIYIKMIVFLAAISLIGYSIDVFHLFDGLVTKLPRISGGKGYEGFLYTFRHAYHPFRNNSIFFEPGAYQAFLNSGIFLIVFGRAKLTEKTKWIYIVILVAALATAGSTTGYLIFSVLFGLFLYRSDMATYSQKLFSVGSIIVVVTIFSAQFYSTLVVKMEDYLNPDEKRKGWSSENRSFDLQTDIMIIKSHIFGLGLDEYKKEFRIVGKLPDTEGSSNGVTSTLASYGVPFGLFIFGSYFYAIKVLSRDIVLSVSAFIMFVLFLWGESYYKLAPISLAIIAAAFAFGESLSSEHRQKQSVLA